MPTVEAVRAAVASHPGVVDVTLVGSRARGDATKYSDWDFKVHPVEFHAVAPDLHERIADLAPLAVLWDRLSDERCLMVIVEGPKKIDLIFDEPNRHQPAWLVSPDTLPAIDAHFWDWTLWLCSKRFAGKDEVVAAQLQRQFDHLLAPLGQAVVPASLEASVSAYEGLRAAREAELGVTVPRRLGEEVRRVVESLP
jgi:predicted nucleotidyltransferase